MIILTPRNNSTIVQQCYNVTLTVICLYNLTIKLAAKYNLRRSRIRIGCWRIYLLLVVFTPTPYSTVVTNCFGWVSACADTNAYNLIQTLCFYRCARLINLFTCTKLSAWVIAKTVNISVYTEQNSVFSSCGNSLNLRKSSYKSRCSDNSTTIYSQLSFFVFTPRIYTSVAWKRNWMVFTCVNCDYIFIIKRCYSYRLIRRNCSAITKLTTSVKTPSPYTLVCSQCNNVFVTCSNHRCS